MGGGRIINNNLRPRLLLDSMNQGRIKDKTDYAKCLQSLQRKKSIRLGIRWSIMKKMGHGKVNNEGKMRKIHKYC